MLVIFKISFKDVESKGTLETEKESGIGRTREKCCPFFTYILLQYYICSSPDFRIRQHYRAGGTKA